MYERIFGKVIVPFGPISIWQLLYSLLNMCILWLFIELLLKFIFKKYLYFNLPYSSFYISSAASHNPIIIDNLQKKRKNKYRRVLYMCVHNLICFVMTSIAFIRTHTTHTHTHVSRFTIHAFMLEVSIFDLCVCVCVYCM
eukprot:GHVR01134077.1.p1 GENE.GHVR01134077.1~~GHVR01134077.1.p1  ORF type:complete len:140 (+),score=39.29 GHVR01134077.1:35-454(+)